MTVISKFLNLKHMLQIQFMRIDDLMIKTMLVKWLGPKRQQAITWTDVDQVLGGEL